MLAKKHHLSSKCDFSSRNQFVMEYCGEVMNYRDFQDRAERYDRENRTHYYFMTLRADEVHVKGITLGITQGNHLRESPNWLPKWITQGNHQRELPKGIFQWNHLRESPKGITPGNHPWELAIAITHGNNPRESFKGIIQGNHPWESPMGINQAIHLRESKGITHGNHPDHPPLNDLPIYLFSI